MATDGTQFLIELNAKFTGGETAVETLAELGDRMLKAGATVADFEAATKATEKALEETAAAAKSAADAVSEQEQAFAQAERSANRAALAVEKLGNKAEEQAQKMGAAMAAGDTRAIERAKDRFSKLVVAQQDAATAADAAAEALKKEGAALDVLKTKAEAATAKQKDVTKSAANLKSAGDQAAKTAAAAAGSGKIKDMASALSKIGGPAGAAGSKLGEMAGAFEKLQGSMGAAGPYGAIALAIIAITTAAIAATIAIAQWGVEMADANRTQGLLIDGLAGTAEAGADLAASIDNVSTKVPLTKAELMDLASDLKKSGVAGDELGSKLEEAAIKASKAKFGPDFVEQMKSLPFQAKVFEQNLKATFGGLKIDPLLEGLQTLGALFDESTASGKAMKFMFEALFQPLVDAAVAAIPKVERFFLYLEILALKAYIALKPYGYVFEFIGKAMLVMAGITTAILAVALGVVAAIIAWNIALFAALAFAVYGLYEALLALVTDPMAALKGFADFMGDLGKDIVMGLVNGIKAGAVWVYDALVGVVTGAMKGVKEVLGIGSPSKVFAEIGGDTVAGFSEGVDDSSADAQGSLEAMVAPPERTAAQPGGAGGGLVLNIAAINVTGEDAKEQARDFVDQLIQTLETMGITVGGGVTANA